MTERQRPKPPRLGSAGYVESLVQQGMTLIFSEPIIFTGDGLPKTIVKCTVLRKGEEFRVDFMPKGSATQVRRRAEQALSLYVRNLR